MLLYQGTTNVILNAFYEVYNTLGGGFVEKVYENALCLELKERGLHVENQKELRVFYKEQEVGLYKADIVVDEKIILELKAIKCIQPENEAQCINYLKATGMKVGYVLNFGPDEPEFKRLVNLYP